VCTCTSVPQHFITMCVYVCLCCSIQSQCYLGVYMVYLCCSESVAGTDAEVELQRCGCHHIDFCSVVLQLCVCVSVCSSKTAAKSLMPRSHQTLHVLPLCFFVGMLCVCVCTNLCGSKTAAKIRCHRKVAPFGACFPFVCLVCGVVTLYVLPGSFGSICLAALAALAALLGSICLAALAAFAWQHLLGSICFGSICLAAKQLLKVTSRGCTFHTCF